jgi:uncharacterized delta-60 repeat protein
MNKKFFMLLTSLIGLSFSLLDSASTPNGSRVYADRFVEQVEQTQEIGQCGSLDETFGENGFLSLQENGTLAFATVVKALQDGSILVVIELDTQSQLIKYHADGSIDQSFATNGIYTLSGYKYCYDIIIDSDDNILLMGEDNSETDTPSWIFSLTQDGQLNEEFEPVLGDDWNSVTSAIQLSSGNFVFGGQNSGNNYPRMTSYTPAGMVNTNFGVNGNLVLDGQDGRPSAGRVSTYAIASNNLDQIYIAYKNGTACIAKFNSGGQLIPFADNGVLTQALGSSMSLDDQIEIVLDSESNVYIAGTINDSLNQLSSIVVHGYDADGVSLWDSSITLSFEGIYLILLDLIALEDGTIFVIGHNTTDRKVYVASVNNDGTLNSDFSENGYIEFNVDSNYYLDYRISASVGPDGRLYTAHTEYYNDSYSLYLSRIINKLYVSEIPQYSITFMDGDLDLNFGDSASQTYRGISYLFNGKYGSRLEQKPHAVIVVQHDQENLNKIIVGMDGKTNESAQPHIMLARMDANGNLDLDFGVNGYLTLEPSYDNEFITNLLEDENGNIYVSGYAYDEETGGHAILRKLDNNGNVLWPTEGNLASESLDGNDKKVLGIGIQSSQRIIAFMQDDDDYGAVRAYNPETGALDVTFNAPYGEITVDSFDGVLEYMGPIYGFAIEAQNNILIAYKNDDTDYIDAVYIDDSGSHLVSQFGNNGIAENICNLNFYLQDLDNLRLALDNSDKFVIAFGVSDNFYAYRFFVENGQQDMTFGNDGYWHYQVNSGARIYDLATTTNNNVIMVGADNNLSGEDNPDLFITRINSQGFIDSLFNPYGDVPGVLSFHVSNVTSSYYYDRVISSIAIQPSTGDMIVTGFEEQRSIHATPMVARIINSSGEEIKQSPILSDGVAGTIDTTFGNEDGTQDFTDLLGSGSLKVVLNYPSDHEHAGKIVVGMDTVDQTVVLARLYEHDLSLDEDFGTNGITTLISIYNLSGLHHLSLDADDNIIACGSFDNKGWAKRIDSNGVLDVEFVPLTGLIDIYAVYQQKSGRYIACGRNSLGRGTLVAFQNQIIDDYLQVETTFNPLGVTAGWYPLGTTGLYNLVINEDDTILTAYADINDSNIVKITKITANGSAVVESFGGGVVNTGISPKNTSEIRIALDNDGKVYVATSVGTGGTQVKVACYGTDGIIDPLFNEGSVKTITGLGSIGVSLASVLVTTDDKVILSGFNTAGANGKIFVVRLTDEGDLDPIWNVNAQLPDVPGILTFSNVNSFAVYNATIFVEGSIFLAGVGSTNIPLLHAVFGDSYIMQAQQQPQAAPAGTLDYTLDSLTPGSGSLNLLNYLSDLVDLSGFYGHRIHIYEDGSMLLGFSNNSDEVIVVKLKADRSVDTSFNQEETPGYISLEMRRLYEMTVVDGENQSGNIYLGGRYPGGDRFSVIYRITSQGVDTGFQIIDELSERGMYTIRETSNGRILFVSVRQSDEQPVIVAYKYDGSERDITFGNDGEYVIENSDDDWWLDSSSIDSQDRMYYSYWNDNQYTGMIVTERLQANGTGLDAAWSLDANFVLQEENPDADYIRTVLDEDHNKVIVVVSSDAGFIYVRYYNATTGEGLTDVMMTNLTDKHLKISDVFFDQQGYAYIVGLNETDSNIIALRYTPEMELDSSYAQDSAIPGMMNVNAGSDMNYVYAGGYHKDRRIYILGGHEDDETVYPCLAAVFGDFYSLEESQATFTAVPGTVDVTIDPNEGEGQDAGLVLSSLDESLVGLSAKSIYTNSDGSYIIACNHNNGVDGFLIKLNPDQNLHSNFGYEGTPGITTYYTIPQAVAVISDEQERFILVGMNESQQKVLRFDAQGQDVTNFRSGDDSNYILTAVTGVVQARSGMIIVSGKNSSYGLLLAYKFESNGEDDIATTFGSVDTPGYYSIGINRPIDDVVINESDEIFITYRNESNSVYLRKINAQGDQTLVELNTGIVANNPARIAINQSGNIFIAAPVTTGVATCFYDGQTISGSTIQTVSGNFILADSYAAQDSFIIAGHTTDPLMVVMRFDENGIIDSLFNPEGTTPGIATLRPEGVNSVTSMSVQPDGKIVMVGLSSSDSVFMSVYGNPYVGGHEQYPAAASAGTLDRTLHETEGDLNLDTLLSINLEGYIASRVHTFEDNTFLITFENGTDVILAKLHHNFTLDSSFNEVGYRQILGISDVHDLYVDENDTMYIAGGLNPSWIYAFNLDGSDVDDFDVQSDISLGGYSVALQNMDGVLLAGQDEYGVIYRYATTTGELDSTFGNSDAGIFTTNIASPIADISVDNQSRIVFVCNNGSNQSLIGRIYFDGSSYDDLDTPTSISNVRENQLQVIHDVDGNIILAAATSTGFEVRRYDTNGADLGDAITINTTNDSANLAALYATLDENITLIGYDVDTNEIIVVRINQDFILDPLFNPQGDQPGVLRTVVGEMGIAKHGALYNDARIFVVGGNSAGDEPYMCRVFGDSYTTEVLQSDLIGSVGTLQDAYGQGGAVSLEATLGTSIPHAILALTDGNVFVGTQDYTTGAAKILKINDLGEPVQAFGYNEQAGQGSNTGVTSFISSAHIRDLQLDHAGYLLATGGIDYNVFAYNLNPTTGAFSTFADATLMKTSNKIGEQTNDRILIAGSSGADNGMIAAFTPSGESLDMTFGVDSDGYFYDEINVSEPITSFAIDSINRIFVGYRNNNRAAVACVLPNGTGLDADIDDYVGFAQTGFIGDVFGGSDISGNVYVAVNDNDQVIVAAVNDSGSKIVLQSFDAFGIPVATAVPVGLITNPVVTGMMISQENKVVIFGNTTDAVFTMQFTHDLNPDVNFGVDGNGISTFTIEGINAAYAGSMVVNGTMYVAGNDPEINPIVMSIFADRFVGENDQQPTNSLAGSFDLALNGTGRAVLADRSEILSLQIPKFIVTDEVTGKMLVLFDNGTHSTVGRLNADGFLDTSFGVDGLSEYTMPNAARSLTIDRDGDILACGDTWLAHYAADGSSVNIFQAPSGFTRGSQIGVQTTGRYIFAGYDANTSSGSILGYTRDFTMDESFGSLTLESPINNRFATGVDSIVNSCVVMNDDTIVYAYNTPTALVLSQLNASGSSLVDGFGLDNSGTCQALPGTAVSGKAFLIKDENENLIVATKTNTNEISVRRYNADASSSDRFILINMENPTLAAMEETAVGDIIISGYSGTENVFVLRLLASDFSVDPNFGDGGLFESPCAGLSRIHSAAIRADGKIILVGQDIANNGLLVSVNADPYVTRNLDAVQYPADQGHVGDVNMNFGQEGILDIDLANLNLEYARHIYAYADGKKIIACNNGTQTTVMRLNKDNSLDTSFGNDGAQTNVYTSGAGYISLMNAGVVNDMFVNDGENGDHTIYLVGDYAGVWYAQISEDGEFLAFDNTNPSSLIDAWRICMGTNNRLYIAGQTETSGIIQGIQPFVGLDLSFGNGDGVYQTGVASPIMDMAVDRYDRKYIAFLDGPVIKVQRILPNGSAQDSSFVASNITGTGLSATQIRLDLNSSDEYLYVAVQDQYSVFVYRYETESGNLVGSVNFAGEAYFTVQDIFIDDTEFGYVVGYINNALPFIGRFNAFANQSTINIDATYGNYEGMTIFEIDMLPQAGIVDLDGNLYFVGQNDGATDVSMVCLYGDNYNLESAESNTLGLPGTINRTINPNEEDYDSFNARLLSDAASFGSILDDYTARLIFANADGSSYIAFGNGTYMMIGKVDSDYYPVTNFGTNGLSPVISMANVNGLTVDAQGRVLVSGTQAGASLALRFDESGIGYETFTGAPILVVGTTICEQKSGRVLLAGRKVADGYSNTAAGTILAYRHTADVADITFGPADLDGFYAINVNQQIDDMVVNDDDDIFIVYRDGTVKVQKVMQDGSGKDADFNNGNTLDTGLLPSAAPVIAINDSQNVLVAVTTTGGIHAMLYDGSTGEYLAESLWLLDGTTVPVATDIVAFQDDFMITVYTNTDVRVYKILGDSGVVDEDFGDSGVFISSALSVSQILDAAVQPDGTVLMVGNAVDGEYLFPLIMSCYGTPFVSEFPQFPIVQNAGTFDRTLNPDLGDFDLYDAYPSANLSGFSVKKIHMYANGDMLFACDNNSEARLIAVHKDLSLNTSIFDEVGYVTLNTIDTVRSLHVDSNGYIYVAGGYDGDSSLVMLYADGSLLTTSEVNLNQESIFVGTQSFGRTLLAGTNNNYSGILAYNRSGTLDTTFGMQGAMTLLPSEEGITVAGFVIDANDNIISASVDSGSSLIGMYDQTGKIYDSRFDEIDPITGITNNELKIVQDTQGEIILVAAVSGGYQVRKYDLENETSSYINISVNYAHLSKVYMTNDGKLVIIGYTDYEQMIVVRITQDLELDETFNPNGSPAGVLVTNISARHTIFDGMIYGDNRIYCVGGGWNSHGVYSPYMNRVYGDDYVEPLEQVAAISVPGVLDLTFGDDNNGAIDLADFDEIIGSSIPKSLLVRDNGSIIVAMQSDADDALILSLQNSLELDSPSLISASNAQGLEQLFEDEHLNLVIAGNTGSASWVQRFGTMSGETYGTFPTISSMTSVVGLLSSSVGRLIAGGRQDGSYGVLVGLTPLSYVDNDQVDDALFDVSFGDNGRFTHPLMTGVNNFVIDPYDKILVGFVSSGVGKITRVLPNGSDLDLDFGTSGNGIVTTSITNIVGADSMRIAIDNEYQVICAASTTSGIMVFRYVDDSMTSTNIGLIIPQGTTGLVNPVVTGILTTTTNQIIVYGYEDTEGGLLYVLRLTADGLLDEDFNPQGTHPCVLTYEIDDALAVKRVYDAVISPEGRILSAVFESND